MSFFTRRFFATSIVGVSKRKSTAAATTVPNAAALVNICSAGGGSSSGKSKRSASTAALSGGSTQSTATTTSTTPSLLVKAPLVLSFDLGVKKIAYCLFETEEKRILDWSRVDLADAGVNTASVEDTVDFFDKFIAERKKFFRNDCHVLIENQVSARLRVMQAVAYTVFRAHATTQILQPRRVRQHFDISTGLYSANKKASVVACEQRLTLDLAPDDSARWLRKFNSETKRDDLADCFLQALYWRQLIWKEKLAPLPKSTKTTTTTTTTASSTRRSSSSAAAMLAASNKK